MSAAELNVSCLLHWSQRDHGEQKYAVPEAAYVKAAVNSYQCTNGSAEVRGSPHKHQEGL